MKLNILMDDIEKHNFFGPINAGIDLPITFPIKAFNYNVKLLSHKNITFFCTVVYTIEFQKRGLPHAHIILWLEKDGLLMLKK
jgi:hypothetical protein